MGIVTPSEDELSVSMTALNNLAGVAWMCDTEDVIMITLSKNNHFMSLIATCGIHKLVVDAEYPGFSNRREINYRFKVGAFRKFVKKLSNHYKMGTGKIFIKPHHYKLEVTMPSLISLTL